MNLHFGESKIVRKPWQTIQLYSQRWKSGAADASSGGGSQSVSISVEMQHAASPAWDCHALDSSHPFPIERQTVASLHAACCVSTYHGPKQLLPALLCGPPVASGT